MAEIWNNSSVLRQGSCVLWPQASNDRWRLRKYLALSCLAVRQNRSWRGLHALHVLSALFAIATKPAYILPSHTHTASSDIKKVLVLDQLQAPPCHWLRTIMEKDMEKSSSAGICNHDWMAIGWRLQSQFNAQVRQATFWTRTGVRVAESCAKRLTASRWWTRRSLKWCMSKLGKFSLQVTMVLWIPFRTSSRLTKKHLFQNRKFAQSGLREVLTTIMHTCRSLS